MMVGSPTTTRDRAVRPTPVRGRLLDPKLPAFWLTVGLVVVGGWQLGVLIHRAISAYPLPSVVALGLFGLYAVPFVVAIRTLDYLEQEPPILLAVAFIWGGVVATTQAIPANTAVRNILATLFSPTFADTWSPAISAPVVEEILKACGVLVIVLLARAQINSTLDGFVYGALVGLGFQVVEDFVYAVNAVNDAVRAGSSDWLTPVITTFLARGLLGGLWSHTMFTALAGAGIGYAMIRTELETWPRIRVAVLAFLGAWAFHFVWNTPLLVDGFDLGVGGVVAVVVLKGLPGLIVVLLLVRVALRHEAGYYADLLRRKGDPNLVTEKEVEALVTGRNRVAARRYARSRYGRRAAAAVSRLQRAQARYAVELSRHVDGPAVDTTGVSSARRQAALQRRKSEVEAARQRLRGLGMDQVTKPTTEPPLTPIGVLSVVCGLVGLITPMGLLVGFALAGLGFYQARRRRAVPDSRLYDGVSINVVGAVLWLLSAVIFDVGGR